MRVRVLVSAGAARLARSPVSPSTGSICPLRGRHKEANSKTGKQLQLGRLEVLQARLRLPLLGRNSRRETDKTITRIQTLRGRASLGRCSHVCTPSVSSGFRSTPGTLWFQASLPQAMAGSPTPPYACPSLGALAPTLEPIAGCLWGSWGGGRGYAWGRSSPRSLPIPTASHPSPSGPRQFPKSPGGREFISGGRM